MEKGLAQNIEGSIMKAFSSGPFGSIIHEMLDNMKAGGASKGGGDGNLVEAFSKAISNPFENA